jgi:hypothetical protein
MIMFRFVFLFAISGMLVVHSFSNAMAKELPSTQQASENKVFVDHLRRLLADDALVNAARQTFQITQASAATQPATRPASPLTVEEMIEAVREIAPEMLQASHEQVAALEANDDRALQSSERIGRAIQALRDFKSEYPPITRRLIELHRDGLLLGWRLEIAARIVEAHVSELLRFLNSGGNVKGPLLPI